MTAPVEFLNFYKEEKPNFPKLPGFWILSDESQLSPELIKKVVAFFMKYPMVLNAFLFVGHENIVLERTESIQAKNSTRDKQTTEISPAVKVFADEVLSAYQLARQEVEFAKKNMETLGLTKLIKRLKVIITPDDLNELRKRQPSLTHNTLESLIKSLIDKDGKTVNLYRLTEFLQANLHPATWSLVKDFTNSSKDWKESTKKPHIITLQSSDELDEKLADEVFEIFATAHPSKIHIRVSRHTIVVKTDGSISGVAKHPSKKGEQKRQSNPRFRREVRENFGSTLRESFKLNRLAKAMKNISIAEIMNLSGVQLGISDLVELILIYTSKGKAQALTEVIFGERKKHPQLLIDFIDTTNRVSFDKKIFLKFMYHHCSPDIWEKICGYISNHESQKNTVAQEELISFTGLINEFQIKSILTSLNFLITKEEFQLLHRHFGVKIDLPDELMAEAVHRQYNTVMSVSDRSIINSNIFNMELILQNPLEFIQLLFSFSEKTQSFLLLFFRNQKQLEEQPTELIHAIDDLSHNE